MPPTPRTVNVNLPTGAYDVTVRPGLLDDVGAAVRGLSKSRKAALVTSDAVGPLYAKRVETSLRGAGFEVVTAAVPAGESYKTIGTIEQIYDQLLAARLERGTPLLALGGGVIGDMAGFAAATILRGVPFVQVPTTLLAMVDASVGGKTGVNHAAGKNLIGAFHQPIAVLIDPRVLRTLPRRETSGGLAECIKHDVIRDAEGFARLESTIGRAFENDEEFLADLVAHNVSIKARVVEADPLENGERAHLNFGHTFGHAIEIVSRYRYSHGEAVALGMCAASAMAVQLGLMADADRQRVRRLVAAAGLPVGGVKLDPNDLVTAMAFDKKVAAGKVRFVLPDRIGHVVLRDDVPREAVEAAVKTLKA